MKFDLSYLSIELQDAPLDLNLFYSSIKSCPHTLSDGHKIYKLPGPVELLPMANPTKPLSTWQKFAQEKGIKKRKKIFNKETKKYESELKVNKRQ